MTEGPKKPSRNQAFVEHIIRRCQQNKGVAAALRRADNPDTEYQSWEVLADFRVNLEKPWDRLPFALIAAAIAKAKAEHNGNAGIGQGIASCYDDGNESDQAKAKLRRLLACDTAKELCRILRPLFSLINSKSNVSLDYASLLDQLLKFQWEDKRERVKARWAMEFYRKTASEDESIEKSEEVA